ELLGARIGVAVGAQVHVAVDEPRHERHAVEVFDFIAFERLGRRAAPDLVDLPAVERHPAHPGAALAVDDARVAEQDLHLIGEKRMLLSICCSVERRASTFLAGTPRIAHSYCAEAIGSISSNARCPASVSATATMRPSSSPGMRFTRRCSSMRPMVRLSVDWSMMVSSASSEMLARSRLISATSTRQALGV